MKLLATDYDGTLDFGGNVLESDVEAIKAWRAAGHKFAIVTGRSKASVTEKLKEFDIPVDYYITNNGGMVFDANGNMLYSSTLDTLTAVDLMYATHELPEVASYTVNDGLIRHKVTVHPNLPDHHYAHLQDDWSEDEIIALGRFAQIVFSCGTPEAALSLADKINHYFGNNVTAYPNNFVVDIVPLGISKATGLDFVQAYCESDDDQTFCMGDSYNDIPMLEAFENSAAISLAPSEVKMAASHEFPSVESFVEFALAQ